jgi:hypothetical protein
MDSLAANGNARDVALKRILGLLFLLAVSISCSPLWADGGTVVLQKRSGPFLITLFSDPTPVRVGRADLSVMCQKAEDNSPVLDAKVLLHLRRPGTGSDIVEFTLPAKHDNASNKLLYAAVVDLPSPGNWRVNVDVERSGILASIGGSLTVLEKEPAIVTYWPFFIIVPLFALLFAVNRRLRRGRELRHPRARP